MTTAPTAPPARATLPLLHRFLGIGLVIVAALFLVLRYFGIGPSLQHEAATRGIVYTLSGAGLLLAAIALLVLKPRVPDRAPGQSVEQYWFVPEVAVKVLPVWFCLEGAAMLTAIGYYITGEQAAAVVAGVLIAVFWWTGPDVFAKP